MTKTGIFQRLVSLLERTLIGMHVLQYFCEVLGYHSICMFSLRFCNFFGYYASVYALNMQCKFEMPLATPLAIPFVV